MNKKIVIAFILGILIIASLAFVIFRYSKTGSEDVTLTGAFIGEEGNASSSGGSGSELDAERVKTEAEIRAEANYLNLILKTIELRSHYLSGNLVAQSKSITEIDSIVNSADLEDITEGWETVTLCIAGKCSDSDFLNFISAVAFGGSKDGMLECKVIANLLNAEKYWNTDNTLRFSESVVSVDSGISELGDEQVSSKWQEIVECNGTCPQKDELLFEILNLIAG